MGEEAVVKVEGEDTGVVEMDIQETRGIGEAVDDGSSESTSDSGEGHPALGS